LQIDWRPWKDSPIIPTYPFMTVDPQPIVSDIEFDDGGKVIIGLEDRMTGYMPHPRATPTCTTAARAHARSMRASRGES